MPAGILILAASAAAAAAAAADSNGAAIDLDVRPRICTLSAQDEACETTVHAEWRSKRDESLCLVIVDRPEVQRCWEQHSHGVYRIELSFSEDLIVELRDPELREVLASEAVRVIREALRLRRKRHQPWNVFF